MTNDNNSPPVQAGLDGVRGMGKAISDRFAIATFNAAMHAINELAEQGISEGSDVIGREGKQYQLSSIKFQGPERWSGDNLRGGYVSLHGRLYRVNGTLGTHVHWIGWPEDVAPLARGGAP